MLTLGWHGTQFKAFFVCSPPFHYQPSIPLTASTCVTSECKPESRQDLDVCAKTSSQKIKNSSRLAASNNKSRGHKLGSGKKGPTVCREKGLGFLDGLILLESFFYFFIFGGFSHCFDVVDCAFGAWFLFIIVIEKVFSPVKTTLWSMAGCPKMNCRLN